MQSQLTKRRAVERSWRISCSKITAVSGEAYKASQITRRPRPWLTRTKATGLLCSLSLLRFWSQISPTTKRAQHVQDGGADISPEKLSSFTLRFHHHLEKGGSTGTIPVYDFCSVLNAIQASRSGLLPQYN